MSRPDQLTFFKRDYDEIIQQIPVSVPNRYWDTPHSGCLQPLHGRIESGT